MSITITLVLSSCKLPIKEVAIKTLTLAWVVVQQTAAQTATSIVKNSNNIILTKSGPTKMLKLQTYQPTEPED